jgi:glycolate oxidase iron-sulfur subunit
MAEAGPPVAGLGPIVEPAFDGHHPPDPSLLSDCVHCGFCLPACPTYALWGEEMDSPRGRILLMDLAQSGERPMGPEMVSHWDSCLGCLACVPACPSGVAYDRLLEQTRQQVERRYPRPLRGRLWRQALFSVLPHPTRLRLLTSLLWAAERVGARQLGEGALGGAPAEIRAATRLAPRMSLRAGWARVPAPRRPAGGRPARLRVAILAGCVQRVVEAPTNLATAEVLAAYGAEVRVPPGQGCCGALELHAGREQAALRRARQFVVDFEDPAVDRIAINAAGCGAMLRDLGRLLEDDPEWAARAAQVAAKVRDVTEVLDELGPPDGLHRLPMRVAYHDACHLAHAQGVRDAPRRVLAAIPGLELLEVPEGDLCCGSAGTYNLTQPEAAHELGRRKAANLLSVAPDCVAAGNPGCLLQIRAALAERGSSLPALHPVELLQLSVRGAGAPWMRPG